MKYGAKATLVVSKSTASAIKLMGCCVWVSEGYGFGITLRVSS